MSTPRIIYFLLALLGLVVTWIYFESRRMDMGFFWVYIILVFDLLTPRSKIWKGGSGWSTASARVPEPDN